MPDIDKPLADGGSRLWAQPTDEMVSEIREATYSPSPLLRILHDPSILPPQSAEYGKPRRDERQKRRGRTEVVAALAIAEEEKQSRQLKRLLRNSGERLEYEIRRANAATLRADMAERQEKANLAWAQRAEAEKDEMRKVCNGLEGDVRNYGIQLEAAQREVRLLLMDLEETNREMEELQHSEAEARKRRGELGLEMQSAVDEWYESGRSAGRREALSKGTKHEGIRRWAQSVACTFIS